MLSLNEHRANEGVRRSGVLYHPSSGWVSITFGQDPSHSDDDVTQYMWHSSLQSMASSLHPSLFLPSNHLLPSDLLPLELTTHRQSVPLAIVHRSCNLSLTCGTHHCGENVENVGEEMDNRILRETKCHLEIIRVPLVEKCI